MNASVPDILETLARLETDAAGCMLRDRRIVLSRVKRVRELLRQGRPFEGVLASVTTDVGASLKRREFRYHNRPRPTYPAELPIVQKRGEIAEAIAGNQVVVICGETGSGKTTQLPKICLELGRGVDGWIGHTQPRRIAARSVAQRIADELGTQLGRAVGYKVRFGDHTSDETYVKLMTDGILLAEIQSDRLLEKYDTIIIDEAHERSLNIDFLLGYLKQLLPQRPDLKVIVTSATIDPDRFSKHFSGAPVVMVSGRTYPVEVRYRPLVSDDPEEDDRHQTQGIVDAVAELARDDGPGDVLVFCSGEREIREAAEELRKHHPPQTEILPLYARLSAAEQQAIFKPHGKRRIVLATNVAETSLTVPGIKYVVDTGLARISRYNPRTKVQRLPIEVVSQASANQRKGRCGRVSDGICIRLYSEEDFAARPEFTEPEILRTNLASVILQMATARLGPIEEFPFVEMPDARLIRDGYLTLHELGAVDDLNELTQLGRQLGKLPVDPRIGRMILAADAEHCLTEVLIIASALTVQDPRERPVELASVADEAHAQFVDEGSDFLGFLKIWDFFREKTRHLSNSQLRKACKQNFLSYLRLKEWHDVHSQIHAVVTEMGFVPNESGRRGPGNDDHRGTGVPPVSGDARHGRDARATEGPDRIHRALLAGLLSNVGNKTDTAEYAGLRGTKFFLFPGSVLFGKKPPWVMSAEIVETARLYARTNARVMPEWIERIGRHLVKHTYTDARWDPDRSDVIADERVALKGLILVPHRTVSYGSIDPRVARELFIQGALIEGEFRYQGEYLKHNRKLVLDVALAEAKVRRKDLLSDVKRRFEFYDARVPKDVYNGAGFERWRKSAEKQNPRVLFMTLAEVLHPDAPDISASDYPDQIQIGPLKIALDYVYDAALADDGITATIPLAVLNQVPAGPFEWLVPGWLGEKIVELIRTLPKAIRTKLVPAPDAAAKVVAAIGARTPSPGTPGEGRGEGDFRRRTGLGVRRHPHPNPLGGSRPIPSLLPEYRERGPFLETIAKELGKLIGEIIPVDAFAPAELPPYLKMHFRIVDESGKTLATGRDLAAIKDKLGIKARQSFAALPPKEFTRDGLTRWEVGDLPERIEIKRDGATFLGFPAFVDLGASVGLRVLDSRDSSVRSNRAGVRRLFMLQLEQELKQLVRSFDGIEQMSLWYKPLGTWAELKDDLLSAAVDRALFVAGEDIRNRDLFVSKAQDGWRRLSAAARELNAVALATLEEYSKTRAALEAWQPPLLAEAVGEMRAQLAAIVPARFLTATDPLWIPHLPRYVKAIGVRLRKLLDAGIRRDQEVSEQLRPVVKMYQSRRAAVTAHGGSSPLLTTAFWMLQELRVSLFAQELRTSIPVSVQRVTEHLKQLDGVRG
jgi:ATP-dependent helicase HrpA